MKKVKFNKLRMTAMAFALIMGAMIISASIPPCPPDEYVSFPDPENCHMFYQCVHGTPHHSWCPEDLWYCPEFEICDFHKPDVCSYDCVDGPLRDGILAFKNKVPCCISGDIRVCGDLSPC